MKKSTLAVERCKTVSTIQKILGGKWKIEIIYYIAFRDIHRFGELRRHIGDITESSLTKQLSRTGSRRLNHACYQSGWICKCQNSVNLRQVPSACPLLPQVTGDMC